MAQLDDALDQLQDALDEADLQEICIAAQIVVTICGVLGVPGGGRGGGRSASGVAISDLEGDAMFDPDELGLDPEEFDVSFWRKGSAS